MKIGQRSISTRFSLYIVFVVSVVFVIVLLIVSIFSHMLIAEESTHSSKSKLEATIAELNQIVSQVESSTEMASWMVKEYCNDTNYLYNITKRLVEQNSSIVGSAIAFRPDYFEGRHLYSPYSVEDMQSGCVTSFQMANDNYDYLTMEWFSKPYETGKAAWCEPYFDDGGGDFMMSTYSVPLTDDQGKVFAVLTADISLDWMSKRIVQIKPYEHSYATLVSEIGNYIAVENYDNVKGKTLRSTAQSTGNENIIAIADAMLRGDAGEMVYSYKGQVSYAVFGSLQNGWHLSIITQYRDVLKRATQMNKVLLIVGLFGLIILFIVCRKIIRKLTQPITELSVSAFNMATGNFHAKLVDIKSKDEMLRLRNSFAYLQESIIDYISELRSTAIANERMEGELNVARKIQLGMLSRDFPNNVYAFLNPAKEIGGDLYDFRQNDGKLYFSIGDVSGKGVPAALFMAITRAAFRFLSGLWMLPDQMVFRMNNSFADSNTSNMFCTLFCGFLDLETGELHYCNAGHNPIIVIPPAPAKPYFLKAKPNLAIGLFENFEYQGEELRLEAGTRLLLYTDGVSEAETADKDLFGDERLLDTVTRLSVEASGPQELVEGVYAAVKSFSNGNEQNDDITIMSIYFDGQLQNNSIDAQC